MVEFGIGSWEKELEEQTLLWCIGPLTLAHARATDAQRSELMNIAANTDAASLESTFWGALAGMTGNRLYPMDLRLWDKAAPPPEDATDEDRAFYVELAGLLVDREDPLPFYLSVVGALL
jgi:hypothetical protein